jgi:hypothetical protein
MLNTVLQIEYLLGIAEVLCKVLLCDGLRTIQDRLKVVVSFVSILYDLRRRAETVDGQHMVCGMAFINIRRISETDDRSRRMPEHQPTYETLCH